MLFSQSFFLRSVSARAQLFPNENSVVESHPFCEERKKDGARGVFSLGVFALLLLAAASICHAASIRGVVTDTTGAKVVGARVVLISGGQNVGNAVTAADGTFQVITGVEGRFFLVVSSASFRQLETPSFYAGKLDSVERNLVL
jgi:iron complex outermembrane receptor protein/vitamin B12 transporter